VLEAIMKKADVKNFGKPDEVRTFPKPFYRLSSGCR
jgi:hypothetical protein